MAVAALGCLERHWGQEHAGRASGLGAHQTVCRAQIAEGADERKQKASRTRAADGCCRPCCGRRLKLYASLVTIALAVNNMRQLARRFQEGRGAAVTQQQ